MMNSKAARAPLVEGRGGRLLAEADDVGAATVAQHVVHLLRRVCEQRGRVCVVALRAPMQAHSSSSCPRPGAQSMPMGRFRLAEALRRVHVMTPSTRSARLSARYLAAAHMQPSCSTRQCRAPLLLYPSTEQVMGMQHARDQLQESVRSARACSFIWAACTKAMNALLAE